MSLIDGFPIMLQNYRNINKNNASWWENLLLLLTETCIIHNYISNNSPTLMVYCNKNYKLMHKLQVNCKLMSQFHETI